MGLKDMVIFSKEVLTLLIEEYTFEPGVRKLKEVLFEIIGEINLDILNNLDNNYSYPLDITIDDIKNKFFKDKQPIVPKSIHNENRVGIINGLWANAMGQGGVIPIQCNYFPSEVFLHLKLTGMQGDVMKESMNVALTLAWNLTPKKIKEQIIKEHKTHLNGIHIHCPEGATPKDGPSAGTAITTSIFSLFNNVKINHSFAITGEITLDGNVIEIGGLDLKILGGIKAGVKEFIFPKGNVKDFNIFMEKYKDNVLLEGIQFHSVEKIEEVFALIF
jgi:ATP-dependent Lon protease